MTITAADFSLRRRRWPALLLALALAWLGVSLAGTSAALAASCPGALSDPYSSAVLADAPIAYYRLDESGGTTMCDSSATSNNGTYNATGVTYGVNGALAAGPDTAVAGTGATGVIGQSAANSGITGNHSFTLEGWYRNTTTVQNQILVDIGNPPGSQTPGHLVGLAVWPTNDPTCDVHSSAIALDEYFGYNCWDTTTAGVNLFDGAWHDLAITYDAGTATVTAYVDGHALAAQAVAHPITLDPGPVRVGRWVDSLVNQPFVGAADDVAVYPAALSATRLAAHHTAAITAPGPSVSTTVGCNLSADTEIDTCTATVVDTSTAPTTPTGTVSFTSNGGGAFTSGAICTLSPVSGGGASASCSVTFAPSANSLPDLTAVYSGDATHPASTGTTNAPGFVANTTDLRQAIIQACSSVYVAPCAGLVPAPGSVSVCVSAWQSCKGAGPSKPGHPGTIDMSGLPASVSTPIGCNGSSAKTTRARRALDSPTDSGDASTCKFIDYANDQTEDRIPTDDRYNHTARVILYNAQVSEQQNEAIKIATQLIAEYTDPSRWGGKSPPRTLVALFANAVQNTEHAFGNAKVKDEPVDTDVVVARPESCDLLADPDIHELCTTVLSTVQANAITGLKTLAQVKHTLQLDAPEAVQKQFMRAPALAQTARKSPRHYTHVSILLGSGTVTVAKGKKGKLVLHIARAARNQLRTLKRRGVRRVTATMHLLVEHQGIATTKTFKVTLVLRRKG